MTDGEPLEHLPADQDPSIDEAGPVQTVDLDSQDTVRPYVVGKDESVDISGDTTDEIAAQPTIMSESGLPVDSRNPHAARERAKIATRRAMAGNSPGAAEMNMRSLKAMTGDNPQVSLTEDTVIKPRTRSEQKANEDRDDSNDA